MTNGKYGEFGGQYIPETLMSEVINLEKSYDFYKNDEKFNNELNHLLKTYAGRPSLLYFAKNMTKDLGGAKVYLKREDLNHTGSHKINNVLGQALLAKYMGKTRIIAETGAGQHGVATATAAALLNLECEVFMGEEDIKRQALNVYRMELLGAKVNSVKTGTGTLKDAVSEAMREWTRRVDDTLYVFFFFYGYFLKVRSACAGSTLYRINAYPGICLEILFLVSPRITYYDFSSPRSAAVQIDSVSSTY